MNPDLVDVIAKFIYVIAIWKATTISYRWRRDQPLSQTYIRSLPRDVQSWLLVHKPGDHPYSRKDVGAAERSLRFREFLRECRTKRLQKRAVLEEQELALRESLSTSS